MDDGRESPVGVRQQRVAVSAQTLRGARACFTRPREEGARSCLRVELRPPQGWTGTQLLLGVSGL